MYYASRLSAAQSKYWQTATPIYHLAIMGNRTTSLISTVSRSNNTPGEKAAFYVFQAVPEVVTSSVLLVINAKEVFGMAWPVWLCISA